MKALMVFEGDSELELVGEREEVSGERPQTVIQRGR